MNKEAFWHLIEEANKHQEEKIEWIEEFLSEQNLEESIDFEIHLTNLMKEAYTSDLWGAAYIIMGGCSDDCFDYFLGWLISQGEKTYTQTLKNPEFLSDYINEETLSEEGLPQLEEFLELGFDAFSIHHTGETEWNDELYETFLAKMKEKGSNCDHTSNITFDWEDEEDLAPKFPKLWERFGENPL
ncbi:molybdenum metabolism regulator [Bacillaceae bacterium SAS-127]|nr:molybdenum metabolism regulator [Bacillaceae bacterium SAS-127]